ncbi:MAG: hypothetical protein AB1696_21870 [Planctomycetota bacterium]
MKKLGIGCGVIVLVFVVILVVAFQSGEKQQEEFFAAVLSGDPAKVTAMLHPAFSNLLDEPVLQLWMNGVKEGLGEYKGLSATNFNASTNKTDKGWLTESKGTVNFEKGTAESELQMLDGKITMFKVDSDKIDPKKWFAAAPKSPFYHERGKNFLTLLLTDKVNDAFAMMHESLQQAMPLDKLNQAMPSVKERFGGLKSIEFASEEFTPGDSPKLKVLYKVLCEKGETTGYVTFQFIGLKGHILGFRVPAEG